MPDVNRTPTGRLIDTAGIAAVIGKTRQRAWQLTREASFPAPLDVLANGPVWERQPVLDYLAERPADRRTLAARIAEGRSAPGAQPRAGVAEVRAELERVQAELAELRRHAA